MRQDSPICVWDFTISEDKIKEDEIIKIIKGNSKKYAFQLEVGATTGYKHYQGRISLKMKKRLNQVIKIFGNKFHWSITSNENKNNCFYVLKEETRISEDKVWKDTDEEIYIPRQIREIKNILRPFQSKIIELSKIWDKRHIHIIYNQKGNLGKTILKGYMRIHKLGRPLPFVNNYKDLLRMVCDMPTSNCYLIDIPRAIKKDNLNQLFSGIETLKDGYAYDDRYAFKEKYFDCPNIFVFTNRLPDTRMLSNDRWKIWTINKSYELIKYIQENGVLADCVL